QAVEELIRAAERRVGRALPRRYCFGSVRPSRVRVPQGHVAEYLTGRVYVDEDRIYPCYDLILGDVLDDGRLLLCGYRAGYAPRPWGRNWTGRDGPFVLMVGGDFLEKVGPG